MDIKFNTEFQRWEVYSPDCAIRNKEPQPEFVTSSFEKACIYVEAVKERKYGSDGTVAQDSQPA